MKMLKVFLFALMVTSLCLTSTVPSVLGQSESIEVLSYSYHISSDGVPVVVGEIQNTGLRNIDMVLLRGTLFASNETALGYCTGYVYGDHLLPQQKAPFYLQAASYTSDTSWIQTGIDHANFTVVEAEITESYQYHDFTLRGSMGSVVSGYYAVTGVVQNTGSLNTVNKTWAVATFYNSAGKVVTVGYSNPLSKSPLAPSDFDSFTVLAFDSTPELIAQIANYSILFQTNGPILTVGSPTPTPVPTATANTTVSPSLSPTTQSPSASTNPNVSPSTTQPYDTITIPANLFYAIIVAIIVIFVIAVALLRRRGTTK
jgi:hypothetical protein